MLKITLVNHSYEEGDLIDLTQMRGVPMPWYKVVRTDGDDIYVEREQTARLPYEVILRRWWRSCLWWAETALLCLLCAFSRRARKTVRLGKAYRASNRTLVRSLLGGKL